MSEAKPKLITGSFGDCPLNVKCKGCYLETLKENPSGQLFKLFAETISDKDNIYININQPTDVEKSYLVYLGYIKSSPNIRLVAPIIFANRVSDLHYYANKHGGIIFTINAFMNKHWIPESPSNEMIKNLSKINNIGFEVTTNSEILEEPEMPRVTAVRELIETLTEERNSTSSILLNHIPTNPTAGLRKVFKAFTKLSNIPNTEARMSGCLESAVDKIHSKMPCVSHDIHDFIDGNHKNSGCPWTVKTCELAI